MPTKTDIKIQGFVIGDDFTVKRTYIGLPVGLGITATKAWLTIKRSPKQSDAEALMQIEITPTETADGWITDANPTDDGNIALYFDVPRAKSALAKPGLEYVYDIQTKWSNDTIHTMEIGTITFIEGLTHDTV